MSLLRRFRETVLPSSSRNKKLANDDVRHYNYRNPTKSFNEKSVKTKNSTTHYTDSHTDDNNHHHCDSKEKNVRNISKLSRRTASTVQQSVKKNKTNNHRLADNATLSRSNTFTLDEEKQFQKGYDPKSKRTDKNSDANGKKSYSHQVGPDMGKGKLFFNKTIKRTKKEKQQN